MNYIIDPMWIYWLHVLENAQALLLVIAIFTFIAAIVCFIASKDSVWYSPKEAVLKKYDKAWKVCLGVVVAACIILVFVPGKDTLIEMLVAKTITIDNLNVGKDYILSLVKEIVEVINGGA